MRSPAHAAPRLLVDLQACQTEHSRQRGIGRYSLQFALALARASDRIEAHFALNDAYAEHAEAVAGVLAAAGGTRIARYAGEPPAGPWQAGVVDAARSAGEWLAHAGWMARSPDLLHVSSLLEDSVGRAVVPSLEGMPASTVVSATLYDLIPLLYAEHYLADERTRHWYHAALDRYRRCDLLLAISEATRRDAIAGLGVAPDRVASIMGAVDATFHAADVPPARRRALAERTGVHGSFTMYTGGIDHRKNVEGLIRSFARLPPALRDGHRLAVVCSIRPEERARLERLAHDAGLPAESLVLTGFVSDEDLVDLYRTCDLFVFPSKYEGFGLPVLEAMACGAPTIAADNSSLPEIVGRRDALFDDGDDALAAALAHALGDPAFRADLRASGLRRARTFSWDATAAKAMDAWDAALAAKRRAPAVPVSRRPRLALVSPLLPARSGIAEFVTELLPALARRFEIDLFVESRADPDRYRRAGFAVHDWRQLPARIADYDAGVAYAMGNSDHHLHMLALLRHCPGAVILHDAFLSGLMAWASSLSESTGGLFDAMLGYCHGGDAVEQHRAAGTDETMRARTMARWVADRSTGVVVTSRHARDLLGGQGQLEQGRCEVVPLNCAPRPDDGGARAAARSALGLAEDEVLVCTFGLGAKRKHWRELVDAWTAGRRSHRARLVFVGDPGGAYGEDVVRHAGASAGRDPIEFTGYADDATFHRYMRAADVVVQLRSDSRGESSGSAIYAMAYGNALVVTDHGSLADLPDDGCAKLPLPVDAGALAGVLDGLVDDGARRRALGARALAWVAAHCDPGAVADALADHILRFNDPAVARRHERLAARARSLASVLPDADGGTWSRLLVDRARRAEIGRARDVDEEAVGLALDRWLDEASPPIGVPALPAAGGGASASIGPVSFEAPDLVALGAADPRLKTVVGRRERGVIRSTGAAGTLLFGPYVALAPGAWRARVYGRRRDASPATLEVTCLVGHRVLGTVTLAPTPAGAGRADGLVGRVDFTVDTPVADLEIRLHVAASAEAEVDGIEIAAVPRDGAAA